MKEQSQSFQDALQRALKKTKKSNQDEIILGKIPPQAIDLEKAVLGAILLESESYSQVAHVISQDSFYREEHKEIYLACTELNEKGKPIDLLTVMEHLRFKGKLEFVGGAYALTEITQNVGTSTNIEHHAYIIKEKQILRDCIRITSDINSKCYDPTNDAFDLLNELDAHIQELNNVGELKEPQSAKNAYLKAIKNYENPLKTSPLLMGASNFDDVFNFEGGDYIVVAARPGMGKTAFMLEMAKQSASNGFSGAIFSLEMSETQLIDRLIANFEQIPLHKIKNKQLSEREFKQYAQSNVAELPIYIDDTAGTTIQNIRAKAIKLKKQKGIDWIMIDYLQLIKASSSNKNYNKVQEIGDISRQIKVLAKDLDVPCIILSQLSRGVENRGGLKIPNMSDIRESGDVEQDADVIFFLWRPEYYDFEQDAEGRLYEQGETHIICAKYRNGEPKNAALKFTGQYQSFTRLEND